MLARGGCAAVIPGTGGAGEWLRTAVEGPRRPLRLLGGQTERYAYLAVAGTSRLVALEARHGLGLPVAVTVPAGFVDDVLGSRLAWIGNGLLGTERGAIAVAVTRDDRLRLAGAGPRLRSAERVLADLLGAVARPDEPDALYDAVRAFGSALGGDSRDGLETATGNLVGLGFGSTPAGDDLIAGAAATLSALAGLAGTGSAGGLARRCRRLSTVVGGVVESSRTRTTPLSAELMACAVHGHALPRFRRLVRLAGDGEDIVDAGRDLLAVGRSSGYFLATGALLAMGAASRPAAEAFHAEPG
jgi:hypothetical protein